MANERVFPICSLVNLKNADPKEKEAAVQAIKRLNMEDNVQKLIGAVNTHLLKSRYDFLTKSYENVIVTIKKVFQEVFDLGKAKISKLR